ncbi:MAG TPA: dihydroxyacetone kinase phosphoryl donor subunit DhaM [Actinocrinis sp.]
MSGGGPDGSVPGPVGLVLVSHSAQLARGAAELAGQLAGEQVRVEAAGGADGGGLGTSIEAIERAVAAADRGSGVVLLADLGSAVLTIRLLLEDGAAAGAGGRAVLADAPFVEGAVAAAVAAASGADLAAVVAEAESARTFRKVP